MLERLAKQIELTADQILVDLMNELRSYPAINQVKGRKPQENRDYAGVVVPLELVTEGGCLTFLSTTTIFGTPVDVTLSELAVESFFPADDATAESLRLLSERRS